MAKVKMCACKRNPDKLKVSGELTKVDIKRIRALSECLADPKIAELLAKKAKKLRLKKKRYVCGCVVGPAKEVKAWFMEEAWHRCTLACGGACYSVSEYINP